LGGPRHRIVRFREPRKSGVGQGGSGGCSIWPGSRWHWQVVTGYNLDTLFMVIERYRYRPEPVCQRAAERGRMLPDGLRYVDSWIVDDGRLDRCFQLMETSNPELLDLWCDRWADLCDFEIFAVIKSDEAARRTVVRWETPGR
jgi:uncharacterized protein DUF3303